jgi:hypothetical protein
MAEPLSDVEKTLLKITASEERIERVQSRIARLREGGRPTKSHEEFLKTLRDSLSLMKAHLGIQTAPLASYRCYLMIDERIRGVQVYECRDDAEAFMEASRLLESKRDYQHIEIWQGRRCVGRLPQRPDQLGEPSQVASRELGEAWHPPK